MPEVKKPLSMRVLYQGFLSGLETLIQLGKILVPIFFLVTFMRHTPILDMISDLFAPLMGFLGLPGEAALVLVLGNLVNLYAAVGAMASLTLTVKEVMILSIMLSFSHSLLVETALARRIGVPALKVVAVRILLAMVAGIAFNIIL